MRLRLTFLAFSSVMLLNVKLTAYESKEIIPDLSLPVPAVL